MADVFSKRKRSRIMSRIRSSGTKPEKLLRSIFRRHCGRQVSLNDRSLPGSPDLAVKALRLAVFVDGCFWHGCPFHGRLPKTNVRFWRTKIGRNRARDRRNRRLLKAMGWTVWRIWEHSLSDPARASRNVRRRLKRLSPPPSPKG